MKGDISFLGLMSGLAALLQISAGILPAAGHFLSIFSTAPIMLAGRLGWKDGILTYLSSAVVILLIQPVEVPIFLFTTGLVGLVLGLTINHNFSALSSTIIVGISLTSGMIVASSIFAIPVLGGLTSNYSILKKLVFFFPFSLLYSLTWVLMAARYLKKLINLK